MTYLIAEDQFTLIHKKTKARGFAYATCDNIEGMYHVTVVHAVGCHYQAGDSVIWEPLDERNTLGQEYAR